MNPKDSRSEEERLAQINESIDFILQHGNEEDQVAALHHGAMLDVSFQIRDEYRRLLPLLDKRQRGLWALLFSYLGIFTLRFFLFIMAFVSAVTWVENISWSSTFVFAGWTAAFFASKWLHRPARKLAAYVKDLDRQISEAEKNIDGLRLVEDALQ